MHWLELNRFEKHWELLIEKNDSYGLHFGKWELLVESLESATYCTSGFLSIFPSEK